MTAKRLSDRTFVGVGENVNRRDELRFWTGFSLFRDPWVIAPSSTTDRDGLGPLFNTRSCISCHLAASRGPAIPTGIHKPSALVIRFGPTTTEGLQYDPNYGEQMQPRAVKFNHSRLSAPIMGEGKLDLRYREITGHYPDGEQYSLRQPHYQLTQLAYGPLAEGIGLSPRFAPAIYGAGLIDAIPESLFLAQEDPNDSNNDGISPRYNRVPQIGQQSLALGRFGLKAKHPTLRQQVAAAFRDDIGITNSVFPSESCRPEQQDCHIAAEIGGHNGVEIPDKLLALVIEFNQWLAVPPTRNLAQQQQGRALFHQAQCAACHTPSYITASDYPVPSLAGQTIYPYSNFALHDMGEALADGVHEYRANGREWKTPPLWGLGMQMFYRQKTTFLHDGRARTLEEAILWHGGEAEQSKQHFLTLSPTHRMALLDFLKAI